MANLKPRDATDLLRKCSVSHVCAGCPLEGATQCDEELMKQAAEVIEELSAKVPRWISVDERKPDKELEAVLCRYGLPHVEVIAGVEGALLPTALFYDGAYFFDEFEEPYRVVKWMPMPGV